MANSNQLGSDIYLNFEASEYQSNAVIRDAILEKLDTINTVNHEQSLNILLGEISNPIATNDEQDDELLERTTTVTSTIDIDSNINTNTTDVAIATAFDALTDFSDSLTTRIQSNSSKTSSHPTTTEILDPVIPESVFAPDHRTRVTNTTADPWRRIGFVRVQFPNGTWAGGSGTMISPYHFLTAGHVVHDLDLGGWATNAVVTLGQNGADRHYGEAQATFFRSVTGWTNTNDSNFDWAVITLDRNIGNFTGTMGYRVRDDSYFSSLNVTTAGYPGDLATGWNSFNTGEQTVEMFRADGSVNRVSASQLFYNNTLDTAGGQSGSPVWVNDGGPSIVGVHAYGDNGDGFNKATRIQNYMFDLISQWRSTDNTTRQPTDRADLVDYDTWFNTSFASSSVSTVDPGDNFTLRSVVRNNGTAASESCTVSFYASGDANLNTAVDNYFIGSKTVSAINPFSFADAIWQGTCPNIPRGNYYIGWHIDTGNTVQEFVENNNRGMTTSSRVFIDPNNAPTDILVYDLQSSYNGEARVNLNQVYAFDKDGYSDLSRIDFQLRNPDGSWQNISDATSFSPWANDSRWGITSTSFSLSGLSPGSYTLWAKAYDKAGLGGNPFQRNFTITDTVESNVSHSLGSGFRNLILTGTANINGIGNSLENTILGNSGNNILDGKSGNDTLIGGLGNDLYIVDSTLDSVIEDPAAGTDLIESSISWTLGLNVENLTLTGSSTINGNGNTLNNSIKGNDANNLLNSAAGNDILIGRLGNDTLIGGSGNDTLMGDVGADVLTGGSGKDVFYFHSRSQGIDRITDLSVIDDTIQVSRAGFGGGLVAGRAISAAQFRIGSSAGDSSDRFIYNRNTGGLFFDADGRGGNSQTQLATLSTNLGLTNADIFVIA